MTAPITKVVKNDAYTAPRPPVPVAPTRPNPARSSSAALQPVSRTLQQSAPETSTTAPTPPQVTVSRSDVLVLSNQGGQTNARSTADQAAPFSCLRFSLLYTGVLQPAFSPLEGTKITVNNLHPRVSEEDIVVSERSSVRYFHSQQWAHCSPASPQELFCVCGALKRARLVKVGVAEVVFVRKEDAVSAYRKYNNRCLDGECWFSVSRLKWRTMCVIDCLRLSGQPMKCNLHIQGNVITSDQPILL